MIHYAIAFDLGKNLGAAYNETMRRLGADDWCCFLDGDAMFLHPQFGVQLHDYIVRNPNVAMFTCKTNRVGAKYMLAGNWTSNDIAYHRGVAHDLAKDTSVTDITNFPPLSGVLMLLSRMTWQQVGGFYPLNILGVDGDMHSKLRNAGLKVCLMNGVYVYHWYRGGDTNDCAHLLPNRPPPGG